MLPSTVTTFTPWASLFGGILIGISATLVMLIFGRIAGISGITRGAVPGQRDDWHWRLAFVTGLVVAPLVIMLVTGNWPEQTVSSNLVGMVIAGLLVGIGTSLGSGCTSGHGVCGLARLSPRSLAAVVTFLLSAALTVFLLRHVL